MKTWLQPKDTALLMSRFVFSTEKFISFNFIFYALVHSLVNLESNKLGFINAFKFLFTLKQALGSIQLFSVYQLKPSIKDKS